MSGHSAVNTGIGFPGDGKDRYQGCDNDADGMAETDRHGIMLSPILAQ